MLDGVRFLFPLLLQDWARRHNTNDSLAHHLQQVYAHDAVLGADSEKKMEPLMYHFEAVLRIASKGAPFAFGKFYKSRHIGKKFKAMNVSAILSLDDDQVKFVDNFESIDEVIRLLGLGYIVVSLKHGEEGVEYLVNLATSQLVVAAVQCRFVADAVFHGPQHCTFYCFIREALRFEVFYYVLVAHAFPCHFLYFVHRNFATFF